MIDKNACRLSMESHNFFPTKTVSVQASTPKKVIETLYTNRLQKEYNGSDKGKKCVGNVGDFQKYTNMARDTNQIKWK